MENESNTNIQSTLGQDMMVSVLIVSGLANLVAVVAWLVLIFS